MTVNFCRALSSRGLPECQLLFDHDGEHAWGLVDLLSRCSVLLMDNGEMMKQWWEEILKFKRVVAALGLPSTIGGTNAAEGRVKELVARERACEAHLCSKKEPAKSRAVLCFFANSHIVHAVLTFNHHGHAVASCKANVIWETIGFGLASDIPCEDCRRLMGGQS